MFTSTLIMGVLSIVLLIFGYYKGQHIAGLKVSINMMLEVLPILFFAFIIAGMVQVVIPKEVFSKFIGEKSGLKGLVIGAIAGSLAPGGPYVNIPLVASFLKMGVRFGVVVSFFTGWLLLSISRLPMEIGLLGWKFSLVRIISSIIFPVAIGFISEIIIKVFR
jgi:uncharacterized membrane protein YraQ (UPF0718 family)